MPVISRLVKILIVDDHGLVREGLQAILSRSELLAECVQAWDAASLWQQLEQHADIDLVLMDIQLPDVSGLSLLEELTQRLPQLPVIMLSADHDAGIVLHSLEQGARGFLPKSSLNQVLVSAIRLVTAAARSRGPRLWSSSSACSGSASSKYRTTAAAASPTSGAGRSPSSPRRRASPRKRRMRGWQASI